MSIEKDESALAFEQAIAKEKELIISSFSYSEHEFFERPVSKNIIGDIDFSEGLVHWLAIEGDYDKNFVNEIGEKFGFHPIVIEDILNNNQRPKLENYDSYIYLVVKVLIYDNELSELCVEQECFILGKNYVISFSHRDLDIYNPIQERIRKGFSHIRKSGSDYLLYSLLDIIVDSYFDLLERVSEEIEFAEDELIQSPSPESLQIIHKFKRQMLYMHKAVWPLREILGVLARSDISLIKENTEIYIRDLYEHVVQIMDTVETLRDILSSMMDMYLSTISNKMNEVMKILTIISTLFIPLTFIVGVYGMNFRYMPELNWAPMYPILWIVMLVIVGFMIAFFKKKKWL